MPRHRLTAWIEHRVARVVATMPEERREWGEAHQPAVGWTGRVFAVLGVLTVLPWALFSVQGIAETDAPDATLRSLVGMLVAQIVLIVAFVATLWPWRSGRVLLVAALVGYAAATTLGAVDNHGPPLLAAPLFVGPPGMAAVPIVLAGVLSRRDRRARPGRTSTAGT